MEAVNVKPIIDQLRGAGLSLTVKPDGILSVSPSTNLTDDLRTLIREHKPVLIDWLRATTPAANDPATETTAQPSTQRPDLSPKLQAASKALDQQIVAAGLSLTPPEQPKPKLATSNTQVPPATQPKAKPVKHIDQDWKPLALAYHAHHFKCAVCITAGKGTRYGPRCGVGASLWTGYQNAIQ
jgi:hypothetical protein